MQGERSGCVSARGARGSVKCDMRAKRSVQGYAPYGNVSLSCTFLMAVDLCAFSKSVLARAVLNKCFGFAKLSVPDRAPVHVYLTLP